MKPTSFSSVHRRASTSSRSFSPSAARMAAKFSSAAAATACTSCQSSASSASACTALNISGKRHSPESDTSLRISSCRAISSMAALYCLASSIFGVMTVSGASTFTMVRFSSALPRAILAVHQLFQLILQKGIPARHPRRIFKIARIHAFYLHRDVAPHAVSALRGPYPVMLKTMRRSRLSLCFRLIPSPIDRFYYTYFSGNVQPAAGCF